MQKLKLNELGRVSTEEFKNIDKIPICIVLDDIRSLHNVGSAFRTADAFRIQKIVLSGITGKPPHREIQKTALGATETVDWEYEENIEKALLSLKKEGYILIMIEQTRQSIPLNQFAPEKNKKYCLVFGNEVNGVSETALKHGDLALEIPQEGTKHSLNIAVCLGIVVWEFFKKTTL